VWRRILGEGGEIPSADTLARVQARLDPAALRDLLGGLYARLKRKKVLPAPGHGLVALVLDGHETTASYRRCCTGCLRREIQAGSASRTQYYHRYAVAMLVSDGVDLLLDLEPQRAGEDEVATATRLLERVVARFPRAFDVVLADALYARFVFLECVRRLGKDAIVVLKHEEWALTQEVRALCAEMTPLDLSAGAKEVRCWDVGSLPWPEREGTVRVVRSEETTSIRRQITRTREEIKSTWMWVTTAPPTRVPTRAVVALGHRRWRIENEGFNEAVNAWHMDHVYRHDPRAMEVMLLLVMLAYDLLHVFYERNLKPQRRCRHSLQHIARQILAALYAPQTRPRAPP
jgi:hypothetical protein